MPDASILKRLRSDKALRSSAWQQILTAHFALISSPDRRFMGTNLNWYIVEQLPVIAPADYDRPFGPTTARASSATTSSASPTPPTTWPPSPATSATTARPSSGTKKSAATCAPASTPSTSTSTASPARRRLHPRHLPHRPPPRQSRLRPLPHQRNGPRLLQRPRRRRHRHRCGPLRRGFALDAKSVRMH